MAISLLFSKLLLLAPGHFVVLCRAEAGITPIDTQAVPSTGNRRRSRISRRADRLAVDIEGKRAAGIKDAHHIVSRELSRYRARLNSGDASRVYTVEDKQICLGGHLKEIAGAAGHRAAATLNLALSKHQHRTAGSFGYKDAGIAVRCCNCLGLQAAELSGGCGAELGPGDWRAAFVRITVRS